MVGSSNLIGALRRPPARSVERGPRSGVRSGLTPSRLGSGVATVGAPAVVALRPGDRRAQVLTVVAEQRVAANAPRSTWLTSNILTRADHASPMPIRWPVMPARHQPSCGETWTDHAGPCPGVTDSGPQIAPDPAPGRSIAVSAGEETEPPCAARVVTDQRSRVAVVPSVFLGTGGRSGDSFRGGPPWAGSAPRGGQANGGDGSARWPAPLAGAVREPAASGRRRREGEPSTGHSDSRTATDPSEPAYGILGPDRPSGRPFRTCLVTRQVVRR